MKKLLVLLCSFIIQPIFGQTDYTYPEFTGQGGTIEEYLKHNIKRPAEFRDCYLNATANISFTITETGAISNANVDTVIVKENWGLIMHHYGVQEKRDLKEYVICKPLAIEAIKKECLRFVNTLPAYKPATQFGSPTSYRQKISIRFIME